MFSCGIGDDSISRSDFDFTKAYNANGAARLEHVFAVFELHQRMRPFVLSSFRGAKATPVLAIAFLLVRKSDD